MREKTPGGQHLPPGWQSLPTAAAATSQLPTEVAPAFGDSRADSRRNPGDRLGSYRLLRPLGRGGFGEVWAAEDEASGRRLALKLLATAGGLSGELRDRFRREARLAGALSHPRCVFVYAVEELDGVPALAMELVPGGTLRDVLAREGRVPYRRAVDYALDLLEGLEVAHIHGILHRDVKPSNCFLDAEGRVKVGDFGLSKSLAMESQLTIEGTFLGTPAYTSPEQARGRELDFRSDLYSAGATLYHLLAGEPPFGRVSAVEALARLASEEPPPLQRPGLDLPPGLEKVVHRLLAKDPQTRPASYAAARAALLPYSSRGLGPAGLLLRTVAGVLDGVLLSVPGAVLGVFAVGLRSPTPSWIALAFASMAVQVLYYLLLEVKGGASLGKRLLGLRVVTRDGAPAGSGPLAARTAAWVGLTSLAPALAATPWLPGGIDPASLRAGAVNLVVGMPALALIASTMRTRNGFAGLHELLSGTRVVALRGAVGLPASPAADAMAREADASGVAVGGYRIVRPLWESAKEALFLAFDPLLQRQVWVHRFGAAASAPPLSAMLEKAPGGLHWLDGFRGAGESWDAYEAPAGRSLPEWIRERGHLPARHAVEVLAEVAQAVAGTQQRGACGELSLRHVWLEDRGATRLLPFPAVEPATPEESRAFAPEHWRDFLRALLQVCTPPAAADADPELAAALAGSAASAAEVAAAARAWLDRPAGSLHLRRLAALLLSSTVPLLMLASGLLLATIDALGPAAPADPGLALLTQEWHAARAVESGSARELALRRLAADAYRREPLDPRRPSLLDRRIGRVGADAGRVFGRALRTAAGLPVTPEMTPALQRHVAALARSEPPVSEGERPALLRAAGLVGTPERVPWLALTLTVTAFWSLPALFLAFALRNGIGLWAAGLRLRRRDGAPAGRLRCALRATLAWLPLPTGGALGFALPAPGPAVAAAAACLALYAAGAFFALWRPRGGWQDLIAGTAIEIR